MPTPSKRPDTLETVHIVLQLLRRIPRSNKITATELQAQLEAAGLARDLRTIQRQLEMLTEHFDIERDDSSKPYTYRWKELASGLSLPGMTRQESLLLTLAEQQMRNLLPASLMKSMAGFFVQARNNMAPFSDAKKEREWLSKVRVVSETQPLLAPKIAAGVFDEVSNALYGNRWLEVSYQNAEGKRTKAEVMPLGLAQQGPRLYLVCRFAGYNNERSLALHRITQARATERTFERPKDFDLKQFDDNGRFGFGDGKRIFLSFLIDKESGIYLRECPLSADQVVTQVKDQLKITATVVDTLQLDRWLLSFGDRITNVKKRPAPG
jgi:predicted DNA-binding transcriptional regulator YafY